MATASWNVSTTEHYAPVHPHPPPRGRPRASTRLRRQPRTTASSVFSGGEGESSALVSVGTRTVCHCVVPAQSPTYRCVRLSTAQKVSVPARATPTERKGPHTACREGTRTHTHTHSTRRRRAPPHSLPRRRPRPPTRHLLCRRCYVWPGQHPNVRTTTPIPLFTRRTRASTRVDH